MVHTVDELLEKLDLTHADCTGSQAKALTSLLAWRRYHVKELARINDLIKSAHGAALL